MFICGIVAEYNPFHSGHARHIALTREKTGADLIVCVMSGSFVQRGEPAIFDKWTRATCALACGADAVIELPLLYAVQSAEGFASGGVAMLDAAGADYLSFGCETDDIDRLGSIAETFCKETDAYKQALKELLGQGMSYPRARMAAAFPDVADDVCQPNAILGIEYLKAIRKSGFGLKPCAIRRVGEAYHSLKTGETYSSASAMRSAFGDGQGDLAMRSMPDACAEILTQALHAGLVPVFADCFDKELLFTLRLKGAPYIKTLPEVSEGLENRIFEAVHSCTTREQLIARVKTKRYTYTRISRILLYALLGITKPMIAARNAAPPDHIRVLGVRSPEVLSALASVCRVPLVAGSVASSAYDDMDIAATRVYALSQNVPPYCSAARDYTQKLLI